MEIHELAKEARGYFILKTRDNDKQFYCLDKIEDIEAPEWISDMVYTAHDGIPPNDFTYETIVEALEYIVEENEDGLEADTYNSDLLTWLGDDYRRNAYCEEAFENGLTQHDGDVFKLLRAGQYLHKNEIFNSVKQSLEETIEEMEEA